MHGESADFVVIDVETTGFNYRGNDRVVEIALVRMRPDFSIVDEYTTLVNPQRDVGPTHIHGISASDVTDAPTFPVIAGDIASRLVNSVLVAHNLPFDLGFLCAEFARSGSRLPGFPTICTLEFAYHALEDVPSRKLASCCQELGIHTEHAHDALNDARAAAMLFTALTQRKGPPTPSLREIEIEFARLSAPPWNHLQPSGKAVSRDRARLQNSEAKTYLSRLLDQLPGDETMSAREAEYLSLLDRALEDRTITPAEAESLLRLALDFGMTRSMAFACHKTYLRALVSEARADAVVTDGERRDLENVRELLGLPVGDLEELLAEPYEHFASPLTVQPAEPMAGRSVCFTGSATCTYKGEPISRDLAAQFAEAAGLVVLPRVTKKLDVLVVADPSTMSSKAKKAREYGTRIMAEIAFWRAIGVPVE